MPVHRGKSNNKPFYQWGNQTKYYYEAGDKKSREIAKKLATNQGAAIHVSYAVAENKKQKK
jgi:hypothetical protein